VGNFPDNENVTEELSLPDRIVGRSFYLANIAEMLTECSVCHKRPLWIRDIECEDVEALCVSCALKEAEQLSEEEHPLARMLVQGLKDMQRKGY